MTWFFDAHNFDIIPKYTDDWAVDSWYGDNDAVIRVNLFEAQFFR